MNIPTPEELRLKELNKKFKKFALEAAERSEKLAEMEKPKKPFVLKPHLTQRPFQTDAMKGLRRRDQPRYQIKTK